MCSQKSAFPFSDGQKRYHTYDYAMRTRFGGKVARVCLDAGMTCPNLDGTRGKGGCVYCSAAGSGEFAGDRRQSVTEQLTQGMARMATKWPAVGYIAYFQAHTNTYAPPKTLAALFEEALAVPGVVGIAVATRPDALGEDVCEVLAHFAKRTYFTVELGLQSIHEKTGALIRRGHNTADFLRGYEQLARHGILTGVHLINSLPGETQADMFASAKWVGALHPHLLKLHMLYVVRGTLLADWYEAGNVSLFTREAYVETVCAQLQLLPPQVIMGRLTGDGASDTLLAPAWTRKKLCVLNEIDKRLAAQNTCQGALL